MAKKFKVDDKVRILDVDKIGGADAYFKNGDITHVISVARGGYPYIYCNDGDYGEGLFITDRELGYLELISETPTPQYRTEKRKANVGERILITNAEFSFGDYENGDVLTVVDHFTRDSVLVKGEDFPQISHDEYEVIIAGRPSKSERISLLESQVAELQAKVEALQKRRKPAVALTQAPTIHNVTVNLDSAKSAVDIGKLIAEGFAKGLGGKPKPTPNEQRKAVIERAKAFITEYSPIAKSGQSPLTKECGPIRIEFVVNAGKRTVVAIPHLANVGGIVTYAKAIAKCAPDDVFNADIGKAIALGRALGLEPAEFTHEAVQPTEVVVGMVVDTYIDGDFFKTVKPVKVIGGSMYSNFVTAEYTPYEPGDKIIEDTEAQY